MSTVLDVVGGVVVVDVGLVLWSISILVNESALLSIAVINHINHIVHKLKQIYQTDICTTYKHSDYIPCGLDEN